MEKVTVLALVEIMRFELASALLQAQETRSRAEDTNMQQAQALQPELAGSTVSPWGINTFTMVSVSGAVLYAQGLWGLW